MAMSKRDFKIGQSLFYRKGGAKESGRYVVLAATRSTNSSGFPDPRSKSVINSARARPYKYPWVIELLGFKIGQCVAIGPRLFARKGFENSCHSDLRSVSRAPQS